MKTKINGICRGTGTCFFLIEMLEQQIGSSLRFDVKSEDGIKLPFYVVSSNELFDVPNDSFVLATPMLSTSKVIISVEEFDLEGQRVDSKCYSYSRTMIKWRSRLNYKIKKRLMSAVKSVATSPVSEVISIKPYAFSTSGDKPRIHLVKGIISILQPEITPNILIIDGKGQQTNDCSLMLEEPRKTQLFGSPATEIGFSLRAPDNGQTYCIVANWNNDQSGFLCLDPASIAYYQSSCNPMPYQASIDDKYRKHREKQLYELELRSKSLTGTTEDRDTCDSSMPFFSVIVPLFNTPKSFLMEMIESVKAQSFGAWELLLVNASPGNNEIEDVIATIDDDRIKVITLKENKGIAANTNAGIEEARGEYVVFLDHDDTLDSHALAEYYMAIQDCREIDVLYSDEDFLNEQNAFIAPHFKSDFNIDLLRCHNYITHLLAVRSKLAKQMLLNSEYDGAQDYDLVLRLSETTQHIHHVPRVLYHWRMHSGSTSTSADTKNYADDAGRRALQAHVDRLGIRAHAGLTNSSCFYDLQYEIIGRPLVSIIIPSKDNSKILRACIESIAQRTQYENYEIIVVENNSVEPLTFDTYQLLESQYGIKIVYWQGEFNYSAINNYGVSESKGEYIVLLNNDTEVISPDWLERMLSVCQRSDVGVVGAKLLYPDDTVQHAGVTLITASNPGEYGGPVHIFSHIDRDNEGYMRRANLRQDLLAVTGACMMTKRSLYDELNGLNEKYAVAYNDIDYCLRVLSAGYLVVFEPSAILYHYESVSRGSDQPSSKNYPRFLKEQGRLRLDWPDVFAKGDPYHGEMSIRLP